MSKELDVGAEAIEDGANAGDWPKGIAAHVVSKLSEHGYSIVPNPCVIETLDDALALPDGSVLLDGSEQPWAVFMLEEAVGSFGEAQVQKNFPMTIIRAAAEEDTNG